MGLQAQELRQLMSKADYSNTHVCSCPSLLDTSCDRGGCLAISIVSTLDYYLCLHQTIWYADTNPRRNTRQGDVTRNNDSEQRKCHGREALPTAGRDHLRSLARHQNSSLGDGNERKHGIDASGSTGTECGDIGVVGREPSGTMSLTMRASSRRWTDTIHVSNISKRKASDPSKTTSR